MGVDLGYKFDLLVHNILNSFVHTILDIFSLFQEPQCFLILFPKFRYSAIHGVDRVCKLSSFNFAIQYKLYVLFRKYNLPTYLLKFNNFRVLRFSQEKTFIDTNLGFKTYSYQKDILPRALIPILVNFQ